MGVKIKLLKARLTFPVLWEAKEYTTGDGKPRYSANFLVAPGSENDKTIRRAIMDVAVEECKGDREKAKKLLRSLSGDSGKFCYQDGDLKEYDGYAGNWSIAAHRRLADGAPAIVGRGGKNDVLTPERGLVVSGYYYNATLDIWYQSGKFPGVRATILGLQFVEKGDVLAGTVASADDFDPLDASDDGDDDFGDEDATTTTSAAEQNDPDDDDGF